MSKKPNNISYSEYFESINGFTEDLNLGTICLAEIIEKYYQYDVTYNNLWNYCKKNKIVTQKRRRFFNEEFFFKWTPELCYILGWILSDGSIRRDNGVDIEINIKDKDILESIKKHISFTKNVREQTRSKIRKNGTVSETARITFFSPKVVKLLASFGLVPNKTHIVKWIKDIPEEYENHFIRGIFDGDGSVFISSDRIYFSLCGTKDLLQEVQKRVKKFVPKDIKGSLHRGHGVWELSYSGNRSLKAIFYYMYFESNQTTRLRRKYDKFSHWFHEDIDETITI